MAAMLAAVALWQGGAAMAGPEYIAGPVDVAARLARDLASGLLVRHIGATLIVAGIGLAAGCAAGVALPLVLHHLARARTALTPYVDASAAVPKYALMPVLVLWLGIGDLPKVTLVALLVFYPVFTGVSAGLAELDQRLVTSLRVMGARSSTALRLVMWHATIPFMTAALQIAVPRAVSAAIVGECLLGERGIGYLIERSRQNFDIVGVLAALVVSLLLVLAAYTLLARVCLRHGTTRPRVAMEI
ncbi:MAG: ABC transporter permease [Vicinamibacterales bacterium]